MAPAQNAKVIVLQSHRRCHAAKRRAAELSEAMRRHPSSWPKDTAAVTTLPGEPNASA